MDIPQFVYTSANGYLSFQDIAIINKAASCVGIWKILKVSYKIKYVLTTQPNFISIYSR